MARNLYKIIIGVLIILNLGLHLPAGLGLVAAQVPGMEAATEIFPEIVDQIQDPSKSVTGFAGGVKSGGGFQSGLEQINVPMMEALDKSMGRCVAWLDSQPFPGEPVPEDYNESAFDPNAEYDNYDPCSLDQSYTATLGTTGATDLNTIASRQERFLLRRQINIERCYNMIGNISASHGKISAVLNEGERMQTELMETYKVLLEEMRALSEYTQLLAKTPRVYTETDCF